MATEPPSNRSCTDPSGTWSTENNYGCLNGRTAVDISGWIRFLYIHLPLALVVIVALLYW